jgi:hypothetical protein
LITPINRAKKALRIAERRRRMSRSRLVEDARKKKKEEIRHFMASFHL